MSADVWTQGYIQPSALWNRVVQKVMISPSKFGIAPPDGCTAGCSYSLEYTAPILQCRDLLAFEITISSDTLLYNGTSSLWNGITPITTAPPVNALPFLTKTADINSTIRIEWQSFGMSGTASSPTNDGVFGVECQFFNGTYEASMFFDGTRQC
jgi:hypothetical protein